MQKWFDMNGATAVSDMERWAGKGPKEKDSCLRCVADGVAVEFQRRVLKTPIKLRAL